MTLASASGKDSAGACFLSGSCLAAYNSPEFGRPETSVSVIDTG